MGREEKREEKLGEVYWRAARETKMIGEDSLENNSKEKIRIEKNQVVEKRWWKSNNWYGCLWD